MNEIKFFRCPQCGTEHISDELKEKSLITCGRCTLTFYVIRIHGARGKVWVDWLGDVELPWYRVEDNKGNKLVTWEEQIYRDES